jgi:hypothetical protein
MRGLSFQVAICCNVDLDLFVRTKALLCTLKLFGPQTSYPLDVLKVASLSLGPLLSHTLSFFSPVSLIRFNSFPSIHSFYVFVVLTSGRTLT